MVLGRPNDVFGRPKRIVWTAQTCRLNGAKKACRYGKPLTFAVTLMSERQVVLASTVLLWREWCRFWSRCCCRGTLYRLHRSLLVERCRLHWSLYGVRVYAFNLPCTDGVEPTTLVFVCVDVETYAKFLAHLDVKQLDFVRTEHIKAAATRVLVVGFNDVILSLPRRACSCRNALPRGYDGYDFTFYFHNV